MSCQSEMRGRLNPRGLNLVDVMAGEGRIEKSWLRIFQKRKQGAALWSRWMCWLALGASGTGLGVAAWAVIRAFGR